MFFQDESDHDCLNISFSYYLFKFYALFGKIVDLFAVVSPPPGLVFLSLLVITQVYQVLSIQLFNLQLGREEMDVRISQVNWCENERN